VYSFLVSCCAIPGILKVSTHYLLGFIKRFQVSYRDSPYASPLVASVIRIFIVNRHANTIITHWSKPKNQHGDSTVHYTIDLASLVFPLMSFLLLKDPFTDPMWHLFFAGR
jgi:hypothetical protein